MSANAGERIGPRPGRLSGPAIHHAYALGIVAISGLVRLALHPWLGSHAPILVFVPAIAITSWYWGAGPSIVALIASEILATLLFVTPPLSFRAHPVDNIVFVLASLMMGGVLIAFGEAHRKVQDRLRAEVADRERAQEELAFSEAQARETAASLHTTFEMAGFAMGRSDPETRQFTRVNRRYSELTGYSEDELLHLTSRDLTHPDDVAHEEVLWQELVRGQRSQYELEKRFIRKDGSIIWVFVNIGMVRDPAGKPLHVVGLLLDITERRQAEEARQEAERRMSVGLRGLPIAVFTQDRDLRYIAIHNPQLGFAPEAVLGHSDEELIPDRPGRDRMIAIKRQVLELGRPASEPIMFGTGRSAQYYDLTVEPVFDADMKVIAITCASVEVTASRRRALDRELLIRLTDRLLAVRDSAKVLEVTLYELEQHLQTTQCLYYEAEGERCEPLSPFGPVIAEELAHGQTVIVSDALVDVRCEAERERIRKIETRAFVAVPIVEEYQFVAVLAAFSNEPRVWDADEVELLRTVAERTWETVARTKAETELRELNATLEERVQERTAALQDAVAELEGFSYSVSHDMRAPIRSIVAQSTLLAREYEDKLDPEALAILERLRLAGAKLSALVEDLLAYARLNSIEIRRKPVNLSSIALDIARDEHADSGAVITVQPGMVAMGDPGLVRMVLQNLLSNACKYCEHGGTAHVEVGCEKVDNQDVFFIRDRGIGFNMKYSHKLFRPFERLVRDSEYPGTGIGLANVKRIVERHGGTVGAKGEPGAGATFWFTLEPRDADADGTTASEPEQAKI